MRCLAQGCPSSEVAARALAGPAAVKEPQAAALVAALSGSAAREAGIALGMLARWSKDLRFSDETYAALGRSPSRAGAAYALSRMPKGPVDRVALETALGDADPWTRSLAARAWGKQGLPAEGLAKTFADADWRVRVEAARGLATAPGAVETRAALPQQENPHVLVALYETAAQIGVLPDPPPPGASTTVRCAAAQARDRVRKQLVETPACEEPGWRARARSGALAAELGLLEPARAALRDPDPRVRGAVAAASGPTLADDVRGLLSDSDAHVVQQAAGALAKDAASRDAALAAVQRLAAAHALPGGDPQSDALVALVAITGPMPQLWPTPNVALAAALGHPGQPVPVPAEARALPRARVLRLRTSRGELVIDLRPDVAPLTSSALAALAARGFYDGLTFHRVVPDFVVQGGDPRGDGEGGPGWALPDEHSPLRFLRGTLGIATDGPETGGSQFFLCHSPQPHLDGRYTIAGQLRGGDDVLDALEPGDTILKAGVE